MIACVPDYFKMECRWHWGNTYHSKLYLYLEAICLNYMISNKIHLVLIQVICQCYKHYFEMYQLVLPYRWVIKK